METNECRIMSVSQHTSYMDNNSNVCKSDPDHSLVSLDPDSVGSNTDSTDQTGNISYDDDGYNDDDDDDNVDEAPLPEKVHVKTTVDSGDQSCVDEEILVGDREVDEVDCLPHTACDKKSDDEMRWRLASVSKRNAFILHDFDLDTYTFESNSTHMVNEDQVDDDDAGSVQREVSALKPDERCSTVADNDIEPKSDTTDNDLIDQSADNMDTKAKRGQHKNELTMKGSKSADAKSLERPVWHTCLVCFRERMAALGVSSKSFDNFVATSQITATTACSDHAGEHARVLDPVAEVCGTGSEHRPVQTSEHLQDAEEKEVRDNDKLTGSDSCENAVITPGAGDTVNRRHLNDLISSKTTANLDPVPPETREGCDAANATSDIYGLFLDILREFAKRLDFERHQRERAEDWAEFLMLELDAQINARTAAEKGREALRDRTIRLVAKYKKVKSEHASLVSQIRDMSMPDAVDEDRRDSGNSLLRRKTKSSTNRESLLAKRHAMVVRHSVRRQSSSDSDNSCSESLSETNGKENAGFILRNLGDVRCKWQSQWSNSERRSGDITRSEEINMKYSDAAILNESITGQNEFNASSLPITSTPVRDGQRLVLDESRTSEGSSASALATRSDDGNGFDDKGDVILVDVKASANMWEQLLQKKAQMKATEVTKVSSSHEPIGSTSTLLKPKCIRDSKEFHKCVVEDARTSDSGVHCGSDRKFCHSGDSEDDELSDLEYLSANEEFGKSGDILTDSINAKETRQMWECLSSSNTVSSSPEPSKSPKPLFTSGVIGQVKTKFETVSVCANNNSFHSELTSQRSTNFSSLRSQWEDKGKH